MSVLKIDQLIKFSAADIKRHAEDIKSTHVRQAKRGIDANGKRFPGYTPKYARLKGSRRADPNQISTKNVVPDLTLTGSMWDAFDVIMSGQLGAEIFIDYGIFISGSAATKMTAHAQGRFGRPSGSGKVTVRPDKKRIVAAKQKVGPDVEKEIVRMIATNIEKNLKKLTNRPTVIQM